MDLTVGDYLDYLKDDPEIHVLRSMSRVLNLWTAKRHSKRRKLFQHRGGQSFSTGRAERVKAPAQQQATRRALQAITR